ncbi:hypothetical protein [Arthrobacter sp. KK5.5]|uniref:hypothetical protein n=1 Tax=Arthrobacter sp. KK5.5 TaxID=3373084 RepID=UPI003EE4C2C5
MTQPAPEYAGHTRISTQALTSTARAVAADVFAVPPAQVRVGLNDEFGSLALGLSLPLPIGRHATGADRHGAPTVWEKARDSRAAVRDRFVELTGTHVSRVDVRVTGTAARPERRVR